MIFTNVAAKKKKSIVTNYEPLKILLFGSKSPNLAKEINNLGNAQHSENVSEYPVIAPRSLLEISLNTESVYLNL